MSSQEYKSGMLARILHCLPHYDINWRKIQARFNSWSYPYKQSVFWFGLIPVAIFLSMMMLVLYYMFNYKLYGSPCNFHDRKLCTYLMRRRCHLMKTAACLACLLMVLELVIHISIVRNLAPVRLKTEYDREKATKRTIAGYMKRTVLDPEKRNYGYTTIYDTEDLYRNFRAYALRLSEINKTLERSIIPAREVYTPLKQRLLLIEWTRFLISMTVWAALLIKTCVRMWDRLFHSPCFSLWMSLLFTLGAAYLISFAIALADACQDPDDALGTMTSRQEQRKFIVAQNVQICKAWVQILRSRIMDFRRTALEGRRYAMEQYLLTKIGNETDNFYINASWPHKHRTHHRSLYAKSFADRFDITKKVSDSQWNFTHQCTERTISRRTNVTEDGKPLCKRDRILVWVVLQLFLTLLGMFLFFAILMANVCCMRRMEYYKGKCLGFFSRRWCGECNRCFRLKLPMARKTWKPSFLTRFFHSLPHLNASYQTFDDEYRPRSSNYKAAMKNFFYFPILLCLILLLIFLIILITKMFDTKSAGKRSMRMCRCFPQMLTRAFFFLCTVALCLLLLFEIILHLKIWLGLPTVQLYAENRGMNTFRLRTANRTRDLIKCFPEDKPNFPDKYNWTYEHRELYDEFRAYVERMVITCRKVNATNQNIREVHTPLKQYWTIMEWLRFIACLGLWGIPMGLFILRYYSSKSPTTGFIACAILFCGVASGYLLMASVAVADACIDPPLTVEMLSNEDLQEQFMATQYKQMCSSWKHEMDVRIMNCRRSFMAGRRAAIRRYYEAYVSNVTINTNINKNWPTGSFMDDRTKWTRSWAKRFDLRATDSGCAKQDLDSLLECNSSTLHQYDDMVEDARPLCEDDYILKWLFLQLLLVILMILLLAYIMFLDVTNVHTLAMFRQLWVSFKYQYSEGCNNPACIRIQRCKQLCIKDFREKQKRDMLEKSTENMKHIEKANKDNKKHEKITAKETKIKERNKKNVAGDTKSQIQINYLEVYQTTKMLNAVGDERDNSALCVPLRAVTEDGRPSRERKTSRKTTNYKIPKTRRSKRSPL